MWGALHGLHRGLCVLALPLRRVLLSWRGPRSRALLERGCVRVLLGVLRLPLRLP